MFKEYLTDVSLTAQDQYKALGDYFRIAYKIITAPVIIL